MTEHTGVYSGTDGAARVVIGPVGRGGTVPDGWPRDVPGGAVTRGVWAALCAADRPVTARDVANTIGTRRESANRALGQLERAGWARRERGDAKAGTPDLWVPTDQGHGTGIVESEPQHAESQYPERTVQPSVPALRRARMRAAGAIPPAPASVHVSLAGPPRLAAGELEEHVLQVLQGHPEEEFSPLGLARALGGRSQGAVVNACKRLVEKGEALCSCPAPLRYTAAVSERTTVADV